MFILLLSMSACQACTPHNLYMGTYNSLLECSNQIEIITKQIKHYNELAKYFCVKA